MKKMYKKGDAVYDLEYGWGIITNYSKTFETYPIKVTFSDGSKSSYTTQGKLFLGDKFSRLSFTEYDLVKGGFSQKRPTLFAQAYDKVKRIINASIPKND